MSSALSAERPPVYDENISRTGHYGLAASQFEKEFSQVQGSVLNVAAGHTNLQGDLAKRGINVEVTSVDPAYFLHDLQPPAPNRKPGYIQEIPAGNEEFALTLCHFGIQHIPYSDFRKSLGEMARVTQTADSLTDQSKGTILVGPVFKARNLTSAIYGNQLEDVCGIIDPPVNLRDKDALATLIIKKTPALTDEKLDRLVQVLITTNAMKKRSMGAFVSKKIFSGHSNV